MMSAGSQEVKLSYKIDVHDYDVRKRATMKFLTKGDKVKASIRFKGREMAHQKRAQETLIQLMNDCEEVSGLAFIGISHFCGTGNEIVTNCWLSKCSWHRPKGSPAWRDAS